MLALIDTCHATQHARGNLCACLGPSQLGRLRAVAGDLRHGSGETIFAAGDAADAVFGLRQGVAMQVLRLPDGRRQVLSFLFPGDIFGLAAGPVHDCSAVALTRASLCRIPLAAMEDDADLAARLRAIAHRSLALALDHALLLGRMTAAERVARFLLDVWTRTGKPATLHLPMRVADMGDHLGLRPETVSRCFADLRRDGAIGALLPGGTMDIPCPGLLAHLTGQG